MTSSSTELKLTKFKGNPKAFWGWKHQFEAIAAKRGYNDVLHKAYDPSKPTEVEQNAKGIHDIMLCMVKDADIRIIVSTKDSTHHPNGHLFNAWEKLKLKYQPGSEQEKEQLMQELYDLSKIEVSQDPEEKLEELIKIQQDLIEFHKQKIEDKIVISRLLNSLP